MIYGIWNWFVLTTKSYLIVGRLHPFLSPDWHPYGWFYSCKCKFAETSEDKLIRITFFSTAASFYTSSECEIHWNPKSSRPSPKKIGVVPTIWNSLSDIFSDILSHMLSAILSQSQYGTLSDIRTGILSDAFQTAYYLTFHLLIFTGILAESLSGCLLGTYSI